MPARRKLYKRLDERRLLIREDEQPTEEYDNDELLRLLATMTTVDDDSHFKDAA